MSDVLTKLQSAVNDRYTIERELGRGGNAVVYLARDRKHDRQVAVKVLLPELAVRAERFLREIQIAAKLTDPHILPLYDSGDADGVVYYVMPYIEGESLRDRIKREKQLPVEEALRITREVAGALNYAHSQGVIHRDIKPENILLTQAGNAVVADFGIARALTAASGPTVTETGIAVGTPAYMSPEQGAGSGELDARSDVYSLGCVLYEMLAGHPPFTGNTAQEILARHSLDAVPSIRAARDAIPENVELAVRKALAKQPADRFATAVEFARALVAPAEAARPAPRRGVLTYASLALVLLAGAALATRGILVGARPVELSLAVLPFENLTGDPDNEYLSDGMTEELINQLVQIDGLHVPARTSSFYFKGKRLTVPQIAESLHVATVLEGSLQKTGNTLRFTAQLINAANGYHLWSSHYDREFAGVQGVLPVLDELARAIVSALQVKLAMPAPSRPEDPKALEFYLKGRLFWNRGTEEGLNRAREFFTAAIALDSGYARAYAGLADVYMRLVAEGDLPAAEAYRKARAAADRAVALDSQLAEAYTARGNIRHRQEWDWSGAEQDFRRAVALNPGYALGHAWYGRFLVQQGRSIEGIQEARRAAELDPLSAYMLTTYSYVLFWARQYGPALEQARKALDLEPSPLGHQLVGQAYLFQGKFADAIREFEAAGGLRGGRRRAATNLSRLGDAYARAGRGPEALRILEELKAGAASARGEYSFSVARLYVGLGKKDQAFAWLERAYQEHDYALATLRVNRFFDPLRSDPRFTQLLKKVGLAE